MMRTPKAGRCGRVVAVLATAAALCAPPVTAQQTHKPVLHGKHWMAITGKPLAATAGAKVFEKGGNAVDAAAAMLAATATMWDVLSWGGETQALIYDPRSGEVVGINALGVAPTGATAELYTSRGLRYPPQYGPLAAVTPGTPGGLMLMVAEYGKLSLSDVLGPAIQMAREGYPIEEQAVRSIRANRERIMEWPYSRAVFLPNTDDEGRPAPPEPGQIFTQPDLAATLEKLVEAERRALAEGKSRVEAIYAAHERFYRGDIAAEIARGTQEQGGLITEADLAGWSVKIEEPVKTSYKGIDVYKLTHWTQGPVLLQALNMLEDMPLQEWGYNSARYTHALYQVMNLACADRDFYYGDPAFPPEEPIRGLLSKDYARARVAEIDWERNDPDAGPGDPYPFQGGTNPFLDLLRGWPPEGAGEPPSAGALAPTASGFRLADAGGVADAAGWAPASSPEADRAFFDAFYRGTTSVQAADTSGWVVSITPSGGWIPAVVAGRTGVGLSQRAQSFVTNPAENPYNVVEPGKQPRVTLTPSLALRDGRPFLSFAVQGGDSQDQNLLQFFLNVVEWDMNVQEAAEAANINSYQMFSAFGDHTREPGRLLVRDDTPPWVISRLRGMGYRVDTDDRTSGPINAIWFDWAHGSLWGGSSNHGEDYGIAW